MAGRALLLIQDIPTPGLRLSEDAIVHRLSRTLRTGNAVQRNRIKRRLRELWRTRLENVPAGCDYVLVVRPGLAEAADAQGADWLGERLDELLAKAAA